MPLAKKIVMMDVSKSTYIASNFCSMLPMYNETITLARYPISKVGRLCPQHYYLPPPGFSDLPMAPAYLCLQTCQNNI